MRLVRILTRQLQRFSFPDPVDPFGGAFGRHPGHDENTSLPGKSFGEVPFDDGTIPFGSFAGIQPKGIRPVSPSCQQNPPSEALKNGLTGSGHATLELFLQGLCQIILKPPIKEGAHDFSP